MVVYATYQPTPTDPETYYMLGISDPTVTPWYKAPAILWWDHNLVNLTTVQKGVILQPEQSFIMYQGFLVHGYIKVYFGYRLSDGTVVVNAQPLEMTIN
jgi:hypothetical protein